ncbi:hypothetical protein [Liquorilactobacillus vini]|uniref:hypothetical protein n=1 Tax=Liquorilactobacillus vini TaxID=238015 RepID=UPI0005523D74|nr:hypothetical protein [Liquorilactobacillus vini]
MKNPLRVALLLTPVLVLTLFQTDNQVAATDLTLKNATSQTSLSLEQQVQFAKQHQAKTDSLWQQAKTVVSDLTAQIAAFQAQLKELNQAQLNF